MLRLYARGDAACELDHVHIVDDRCTRLRVPVNHLKECFWHTALDKDVLGQVLDQRVYSLGFTKTPFPAIKATTAGALQMLNGKFTVQ